MIGIPVIRRFGGPEAVLIAVALAFAVSMTAWWHGLYQSQVEFRPPLQTRMQLPDIDTSENVRQVTVIAYLFNSTANDIVPALGNATGNGVLLSTADRGDPNQTLLLVIAIAGAIATAVYCLAIYPAIRRLN